MQSWGNESTLTTRGVGDLPTRSGVTGLACAALGISREDHGDLEAFAKLQFAVCEIKRGIVERDFQTVGDTLTVEGKARGTILSPRWYRCGAAYLAAFCGDSAFLNKVHQALRRPKWPLFLGRKSHVPSAPVAMVTALWPDEIDAYFVAAQQGKHRCLKQAAEGAMSPIRNPSYFDVPVSFAARRFEPSVYQEVRADVDAAVLKEFNQGLPLRLGNPTWRGGTVQ
ncbi:type I-E CRISPR-associated protein Cas5/CasD [Acanthopleuribacter pedis]|uniref:Type I-E CRISPR-associated protein Cas5/CasD n=2 Tax=Acanthopleuribacter pedis TaxID=442870 RepID=A0A8J7U7R3_9BACT|nr:type I-E CRISPR-associated protein Cas5/CasD [Acanthopleuribacter pedis]